jgi:hypothetical protein
MEFAEFIAPFNAGTIRAQYYGRQPLHLQRNGADRDALTADLDRLEKAGVIVRTEMR